MNWEYRIYDNEKKQKIKSVSELRLYHDPYYESVCIPEENITLKTFGISCRPSDWPIINRCSNSYFLYFVLAGKGWCNGIPFETGDMIYCMRNKIFNLSFAQNDPCTLTWISFSGGKSERYLNYLGLGYSNKCCKAKNMQKIVQIFHEMLEVEHQENILPLYLESCLTNILSFVTPALSVPETDENGSFQSTHINTATRYIAVHFRNPNLRLIDVAKATQLSEKYLQRIFKKELGITIQQFIMKMRMEAAEKLLILSSYNINEISQYTGYGDRRSFLVAFKKYYGIPPSQYKKAYEKRENFD